jgi:hypothetical protein
MNFSKWKLPIIGILILGGAMLAIPSNAQTDNHDTGGTNIFNSPPTGYGNPTRGGADDSSGNPERRSQGDDSSGNPESPADSASNLAEQINQAAKEALALEQRAAEAQGTEPRRIVRRRNSEDCVNPATTKLNDLLNEAQQLIEEQKKPQLDNSTW